MLVDSEEKADEAIRYLNSTEGPISADTETTGVDWWSDHVVGWPVGTREKQFYFPVRHGEGYNLPENYSRRIATEVLRPDRVQIGHNYGFDLKVGRKDGLVIPNEIRDSMLIAHLVNENEDSYKLEDLAAKYVDPSFADADKELTDLLVERFGGARKKAKKNLWRLPAEKVWRYGCQDVLTPYHLLDFYDKELDIWKLRDIAKGVNEFQLMLTEMEIRGIQIDREALTTLGEKAQPKADALEAQIQKWAREQLEDPDFPANPRSPAQMKFWLGTPDTKRETLERWNDPRGNALLEYRVWQKLKGSFVDPYWNLMDPEGKIHPSLWICSPGSREGGDLHGTTSSRLSSTKPNGQQVPPAAKHLFVAPEGYEMVELDYSQAELRRAAHYYWRNFGDGNMANLLVEGKDLHQATADAAGIARKPAKMKNFAIQYGAGAARLAAMFLTTVQAERRYLNSYNKMFPGAKKLARQCQRVAEEQGYIRLYTGRTLRFNSARTKSYKAKNRLLQGDVAEMIRVAGIRCRREVPEALPILQVHDSYLFLVPRGDRSIIKRLRGVMQNVPECELPMVVDAKVGPNWGEMTELPRDPVGIPPEVLAKVTDPTLLGAP